MLLDRAIVYESQKFYFLLVNRLILVQFSATHFQQREEGRHPMVPAIGVKAHLKTLFLAQV